MLLYYMPVTALNCYSTDDKIHKIPKIKCNDFICNKVDFGVF